MKHEEILAEVHSLELWLERACEEPFPNEELITELQEHLRVRLGDLAAMTSWQNQ